MICKNCKTTLTEDSDFCNKCGGKVIKNRLTIKNLFAHFSETFFNYDNKFLQTIIHLFAKPENVIDGYVEGTRKRYVNPISFFAISLTISGIYLLIFKKFFYEYLNPSSLYDNENAQHIFESTKDAIVEYNSFFYFILIPVLAVISLIVHYNKSYNYTEHVVIYLYTMSLTSICSSVLALFILLIIPEQYFIVGISINIASIFFHTYLLKRLFGMSLGEALLKFLLFIVLFFVLYLGFSILMAILLILTGHINLQDFAPPK